MPTTELSSKHFINTLSHLLVLIHFSNAHWTPDQSQVPCLQQTYSLCPCKGKCPWEKQLTRLGASHLHSSLNYLIRYWPLGVKHPVLLMRMVIEEEAAELWTHRKGGPRCHSRDARGQKEGALVHRGYKGPALVPALRSGEI